MNFTTVRKGGYDPSEVRVHLEAVAREMGHLEARIRELQDQLSEAQRRAANPTFDEATLASALGAQSAAILRSAHEEAGRVTAEAQERSAQVFTESQQRGAAHLIEAQERADGARSPRRRTRPTRSSTTPASPPSASSTRRRSTARRSSSAAASRAAPSSSRPTRRARPS